MQKMAEQEVTYATDTDKMDITSPGTVTEVEPGLQERNHLSIFRDALDQCIDKCFDPKVFAKLYRPLWKNKKEMLEALIQQVMSKSKEKVKEELERAFLNEDIAGSLSLMDKIVNESKDEENQGKEAWRPSGDPEADSRAYFMALKRRKLQELEKELQLSQNEERILRQRVQEKREKLLATEEKIKSMHESAKRVVDNLTEFELKNAPFLNSIKSKIDTKSHFESDTDVSMET